MTVKVPLFGKVATLAQPGARDRVERHWAEGRRGSAGTALVALRASAEVLAVARAPGVAPGATPWKAQAAEAQGASQRAGPVANPRYLRAPDRTLPLATGATR
jgi:hypothetical protein